MGCHGVLDSRTIQGMHLPPVRGQWYSDSMATRDSRPGVGVSLEPDPVIEAYKKDVDRTLIRENLKLTPEDRVRKLQSFMDFVHTLRRAPHRKP